MAMRLLSPALTVLLSCSALALACGGDKPTETNAGTTGEGDGDGDGDPSASDSDSDSDSVGDGDGDPSTTDPATDTDATTDPTETDSDSGGPSGGMCDPQAQDCPEGEKCTFYRDEANPNGANKCVLVMGNDQEGDPCQALEGDTDTCAAGLHCWGTEPDNATGSCIEFCDENEVCSAGGPCTITNNGALPMCLPVCDPLAPDCPNGWACYDDWDFSDYWFCDRDKSENLGAHGDPCTTINGCDPGLICLVAETVSSETCANSGSSGCCGVVCDITDPIMCPGMGEECISYYPDSPPPQYANVGVCALAIP